MSTGMRPVAFERREWIARGVTLVLYVVFVSIASRFAIHHEPPATVAPITVTLAEPPPEPAKPPPEVVPVRQPVAHVTPPPVPLANPVSTPVAPSPSPAPSQVSVPDLPVAPVTREIPVKVDAPVAKSNAVAEGRFAQEVRNRVEQRKLYPVTARELGMTGTVEVLYVLDRSGSLLKAEIVASSGYPPLDQAALRAVRSSVHAAMPEDAWVGEKQKEFRTKLVFSIDY
jgi:protein TonB